MSLEASTKKQERVLFLIPLNSTQSLSFVSGRKAEN